MKRLATFLFFILFAETSFAQGWIAEVLLEWNHNHYLNEVINSATITFSGVTVSAAPDTKNLSVTLHGSGPITGALVVHATGTAYLPYTPDYPPEAPMSATLRRTWTSACTKGFFDQYEIDRPYDLYVFITLYPRLSISQSDRTCDQLTLSTTTCAPTYKWTVSENIGGPYYHLSDYTGPTMTVTPDQLRSAGLSNPYGTKYFRVAGKDGTTSALHVVDIYYPGPTAAFVATPPLCSNGGDGTLRVDIRSPHPAINDFVVTLFENAEGSRVVDQKYVNDGSTITFSGLAAGNYWATVQNNTSIATYGSCESKWKTPALANPDPVIITSLDASNYSGFGVSCHDAEDGSLQVNASGGTNQFTKYEWDHTTTNNATLTQLSAGNYAVRVQDSNGCWSAKSSRSLIAPEVLVADVSATTHYNGYAVSCFDKADGGVQVDIRGGVAAYATRWSTGSLQRTLTNIPAGTYSVEVRDRNGCKASDVITIQAPDTIDFSIQEITSIVCAGDYSGTLEVQHITNAIGAVSFRWSTGETSRSVTDKSAGDYTVTVSDTQGCSAIRAHRLTDPAPYNLSVTTASDYNGVPIRCHGDSNGTLVTTLRNDAGERYTGATYIWRHNGEVLAEGRDLDTLINLTAGGYQVEAVYNNQCTAKGTFMLSDPDPLVPEIAVVSDYHGEALSCFDADDGSLRADVRGGIGDYTFTWSTSGSGPELHGVGRGTYEVRVTDANGCMANATRQVVPPSPLKVEIRIRSNYNGAPISCAGSADGWITGEVSGGVPEYELLWNTGQTSANLIDVPAGNYSLVVRDRNGCRTTTDTTLVAPPALEGFIAERSDYHGYAISCAEAEDGFLTASATGGTRPYYFLWEGGTATTATYADLSEGEYTVAITDRNGCMTQASSTLIAPQKLAGEVSEISPPTCAESTDGRIVIDASGGVGNYLFALAGTNAQAAPAFNNLAAGIHQFIITDANGCRTEGLKRLIAPPLLTLGVDNVHAALCGEARGGASASVQGGTPPYRYVWRTSNGTPVGNEFAIANVGAGIYTVTVHDANDCTATSHAGIIATDGPQVTVTNVTPTSCADTRDGTAQVSVVGGQQPYRYWWSHGQKSSNGTALGAGTHLVQVTDSAGCVTVATVQITSPPPLEVELEQQIVPSCTDTCDGVLAVKGTGGTGEYVYEWQASSERSLQNLCAGTYAVTVTDTHGCTAHRVYALPEPPPITVSAKPVQQPTCPEACDGQVVVSSSGGTGVHRYRWSSGAVQTSVVGLCPGSYTVEVTDELGCSTRRTVGLSEPVPVDIDLGESITLCEGQTHILDAGARWTAYQWSGPDNFRSEDRRVVVENPGEYRIEVVDQRGCAAYDTFWLETASDVLNANFLLATAADKGDTVAMIDVSWPLPQSISWSLPDNMAIIDNRGTLVLGQFNFPGEYPVSLTASLGKCRDTMTKYINIYDTAALDERHEFGRSARPFLTLYPNPNDGRFEVLLEFQEPLTAHISVWSILRVHKVAEVSVQGRDSYVIPFDLRPLSPGAYSLQIRYRDRTASLRFIVR